MHIVSTPSRERSWGSWAGGAGGVAGWQQRGRRFVRSSLRTAARVCSRWLSRALRARPAPMSNAGSPPPLAGPSGVGLKRKRVAGKAPGDAKKRRKDLIGVGSPASDGGTPGDYGSPAHAYSPGGVGTPGATPAPGTVRPEDDPAAGAADDDDDEPLLPPATYGTEYDKLAKEAQENQRCVRPARLGMLC